MRAQSEREFLPEGAIVMMDNLSGRKLADIIASLNEGVEAVSPCRRLFVSQPGLEPILAARAEQAGASVLSGYDVVDADQDDEASRLTATEIDTGGGASSEAPTSWPPTAPTASYASELGIPFEGRGVFSNSITIYFTADLRPQLEGKPLSVIYVNNDTFGGFFRLDKRCRSGFLVINTVRDPRAAGHLRRRHRHQRGPARRPRAHRCRRPRSRGQIDGVARWRATADVARRTSTGGSSSSVTPPTSCRPTAASAATPASTTPTTSRGSWRSCSMGAPPALLDTYDGERRPVGRFTVEQAYARYVTRTAPHLGVDTAEPIAPDFEIELGYRYHSPAV